jgi:hypothetical protein
MPTKSQLENRVDELEQDMRRLKRAYGQALIDLPKFKERDSQGPQATWCPHSQAAIQRALAEWEKNIIEPDPEIDNYIRSRDGLGWTWADQYVKNGQFAWCGAFAAWCWTDARYDLRQKVFPSCYRLHARWASTSRRIKDPLQMLPGDIVVISTSNGASWGDHITLCLEAPSGESSYKAIEGNARGELSNGERAEGVVVNTRPLGRVMFVYRLLEEDLDV